MHKFNLKNAALSFALVLGVATMTGCSSDDDDNNPTGGNTYKMTVTVNNVEQDRDYISFITVGATADQNTTFWKVNGAERNGEQGISLSKQDFGGTTQTYVIESTKPLVMTTTKVQFVNFGNPLSYSVKIEKNGKTEIDINDSLTGEANFSKDYSF